AVNGRALSLNAGQGFIRLVATKEDDVVVGAQMVGISASDVMAEVVLAIEAGMIAEDIALTIHGHPTLSEAVMYSDEGLLGTPIHMDAILMNHNLNIQTRKSRVSLTYAGLFF